MRLNISVPDELAAAARRNNIKISATCQRALTEAVRLAEAAVPSPEEAAMVIVLDRFLDDIIDGVRTELARQREAPAASGSRGLPAHPS